MRQRIWKENERWLFGMPTGTHDMAVFVNPSWSGAVGCFESFRTGKMAACDYAYLRYV